MITNLVVQHFRSIGDVNLNLGKVNVLVGLNGAGKSNLLDAITFVRDALRDGLDQAVTDRHSMQTIRQWSPTRPYNITISISVEGPGHSHGSFSFTLSPRGEEYLIRREEGAWFRKRKYRIRDRRTVTGYRSQEHIDNVTYSRNHNGIVEVRDLVHNDEEQMKVEDIDDFFLSSRLAYQFGDLRAILRDFETYSIFPNTLRQPEKQSREVYLQKHGENLASVLRRMRRKKRLEGINEIVNSLAFVLPALRNVSVQSVAGLLTPRFLVEDRKEAKPHYFHVNQMADGTLRILGLLVALYQDPRPSTICLEEPELTVHPGVMKLIAESIMEVSQDTQVIVTTHSPNLIDNFDPEEIIAVELKDGVTHASSLNPPQLEAVKSNLLTLGELLSVEGLHGGE